MTRAFCGNAVILWEIPKGWPHSWRKEEHFQVKREGANLFVGERDIPRFTLFEEKRKGVNKLGLCSEVFLKSTYF